jgi:hypothetical protein
MMEPIQQRDIAQNPQIVKKLRALGLVRCDAEAIWAVDFPYAVGALPEILSLEIPEKITKPGDLARKDFSFNGVGFVANTEIGNDPAKERYKPLFTSFVASILRTERLMGTSLSGASLNLRLQAHPPGHMDAGFLHLDGEIGRGPNTVPYQRYYVCVNKGPTHFWSENNIWKQLEGRQIPEGPERYWLSGLCQSQNLLVFSPGSVVVFGPKTPHNRPSLFAKGSDSKPRILAHGILRLSQKRL